MPIKSTLWSILFLIISPSVFAAPSVPIAIHTRDIALVFKVHNHHLEQVYLGNRLNGESDYNALPTLHNNAYSTAGTTNLFTPAIRVRHADGNPSLNLDYVSHVSKKESENVQLTQIKLKDPKYPFTVTLFYKAFQKENVIQTWSEIQNEEDGSVVLQEYASANIYLKAQHYWLTHFHGDWAKEMQMKTEELTSGMKVIDSKLGGTRATKYQNPGFLLALNKQAGENYGEVLAGTLAWSGNFRLSFEVDNTDQLHIIPGINPEGEDYSLKSGESFRTPAFIFTYSNQGKGQISRNMDDWARNYGILDGNGSRLTLLNNWEATYFSFDENKLVHLFDQAKEIGVDLFLLDDGWFGNKYPRNSDNAGLGDWQYNKKKLPHGIGYLVKQAQKKGVKFGIWIEPEMVNPKSELYHQHPDWIIRLPNRPEDYQRNQLVLDLTNPDVQDFVYDVVNGLMTKYPDIAYFKWDCNRTFSSAYSPYLGKEQSKIAVDYVKGLYHVLKRLRKKYPDLPMMLCSGGGGRADYGALQYFTEFWPSDNTNPMDRIFIQWGYSYLYPAIATAAHVTTMGNYPLKFRMDVSMMGKLGFDMDFDHMNQQQITFVKNGIKDYNQIKSTIWHGDLYRLLSPYKGNEAALMYIAKDKEQAVVFTFSLYDVLNPDDFAIKLNGLDPDKRYEIQELNLQEGKKSKCPEAGRIYSGKYLMNKGLHAPIGGAAQSAVFKLVEK